MAAAGSAPQKDGLTIPTDTQYLKPVNTKITAALHYASRGKPVFPLHSIDAAGDCTCREGPDCKAPGKHPLPRNGFKDATADPAKIEAWWEKCPHANIGIPTGERSGLLVLDADNLESLEAFEQERGELPRTATVKTGRGGKHFLYEYPTGANIPNSAGKLGPGLDIRGEGGYIVAPGSVTTGPYTWLEKHPVAEAPGWLIEAIQSLYERPAAASPGRPQAPAPTDAGEPIPEGTRNGTLASIAGRLRRQGYEYPELLEVLERTNEERCTPPLERDEVEGIARSITRYEPGDSSPGPDAETLELLEALEALELHQRDWSAITLPTKGKKNGKSGGTARDVYAALLMLARSYGRKLPNGIEVSVSRRQLAELATSSLDAIQGAVKNLKAVELVRPVKQGKGKSGKLVLVTKQVHSYQIGSLSKGTVLDSSPRLRWSAPGYRRLGKSGGKIIDQLLLHGGRLELKELARVVHQSKPAYLKRRTLPLLEEAGIIEWEGTAVCLREDWCEKLEEEREVSGELEAARRQKIKHKKQREAYKQSRAIRPDRAPTVKEMEHYSMGYSDRRRAGAEQAIAALFAKHPETKTMRAGQITCRITEYLPDWFPFGSEGLPKDAEIEAILDGEEEAA